MAAGRLAAKADALVPNDPRVQHLDFEIGANNYHYMLAGPPKPIATVLLIHGFPDLGITWRYQVPFLTSLDLRVIVPDMLGYGETSAPQDPAEYAFNKLSAHMKALIEHVCGPNERVILGGHDWGGAFVWGMAMRCPETVRAVFSLNTPFVPPNTVLIEGEALVARIPTFRYQLQFASPVAEQAVDESPERLRQFLNGMYGGVGPGGEYIFSPAKGIIVENMDKVGPAALMSQEMVEYYHEKYSRHGLHGPFNWYRTRKFNYEDELPFASLEGGIKFKMPAMVVMGEKDLALPPKLADGMERYFELPLRKEIAKGAGHWSHWQAPDAVNELIKGFLDSVLEDESKERL
jgi:soluble epoxide hydrolase / lipid-phosphate phosphatase